MSEIRITALGNGSGIEVFYKTDSAKDGWCSRPAPTIPCHSWQRLFEHPTSPANQGFLEYNTVEMIILQLSLLLLVEDKSGSIIFVILVVILKALLYDVLRCRFGTCL